MRKWLAILLWLLPAAASAQIIGFPPGSFDNVAARAPAAVPSETITPTNPGTLTASAGYSQLGTYTLGPPAALDWSFDGTGCGSSASSPTIGGGNFSFSNTAPSGAGSHTITVCDHADHTKQGTTSSFTVNAGYQGPIDIVAGPAALWMYSAGSAAIGAAATAKLVGWDRESDSHDCNITVATSNQLATTVSTCANSGENGTAVSSWATGTVQAGFNQSSNGIYGFYDQSGNAYSLTSAAAPVVTANCFSSTLYCYTFNGTSEELHGAAGSGYTIYGSVLSPTFTIIAWIKPTTLTNGLTYGVVGGSNTGDVELRLSGQAGSVAKIQLVRQGALLIATSTCTIAAGSWHSIGVVYVTLTSYAFYADGAACGNGSTASAFAITSTDAIYLGGVPGVSDYLTGSMRGVVIYASALSAGNEEAIEATGP